MRLDLLRHGETGWEGHLNGRTDHPLAAAGWATLRRQTEGHRWPRVVASPLRRCREFAAALAAERGLPLRIDGDWSELDLGDVDGRARAEVEAEPGLQAMLAAFLADPDGAPGPAGGEPFAAFRHRIRRGLDAAMAGPDVDAGDGGPVLVVTHAGPIRVAISEACGLALPSLWSLRIGYGTWVRLELGRGADGRLWGEIVEIRQP